MIWTSYLDLSHFIKCIGVFYVTFELETTTCFGDVTLELESTTTLEFGVYYVG
jgi:hypothetical protein